MEDTDLQVLANGVPLSRGAAGFSSSFIIMMMIIFVVPMETTRVREQKSGRLE